MTIKEYTTVRVDKDTLVRLRKMSPKGNVSGFLREMSKNQVDPSIEVSIEDIDVKFNALKSYMDRSFKNIEEKIEATAALIQLVNARMDIVRDMVQNSPTVIRENQKASRNPAVMKKKMGLLAALDEAESTIRDLQDKDNETDNLAPRHLDK